MFAGLEQVSAPAPPPRELAGIAAFAPNVFPPTHGRHCGTPTEEEEEEEEDDDEKVYGRGVWSGGRRREEEGEEE